MEKNEIMQMAGGGRFITLPQNLLSVQPTLIDDFEVAAQWVVSGASAVKVDDIVHYKTGSHSQGYISGSGVFALITKDFGSPINLTGVNRISLWIYIDNPEPINDELATASFLSFSHQISFGTSMSVNIAATRHIHGWQHYQIPLASFQNNGGETWDSIRYVRCGAIPKAGKASVSSFDTLEWGHVGIPAMMFWFDDGYASIYNDIFPILKSHNIRATQAITLDWIETPGYMSWAQLQELDAAGWTIVGHGVDHTTYTTLTEAQQETDMDTVRSALISNNLNRGANYVAFPGGLVNNDTFTAMANLGMLSGRIAGQYSAVGIRECYLPTFDIRIIPCGFVGSSASVVDVETYIDNVISKGIIASIYGHNPGGVGEMSVADWTTIIEYVATKAKARLIYPITHDDYYKLTIGSVSVLKST